MKVEARLTELGLAIPDLEALYQTNASGAHYISHYPVQNLLYLSGTTPRRDGRGYLPGVVGKDRKAERYMFCDCSAESPSGRRSVCYDREGLESRKEHRPENSAVETSAADA